ncbi:hypothetical protein PI124_g875 [Phytophthora idaei]|nr:hypothetical protein PI124_g875 [Phytophthora idaei]
MIQRLLKSVDHLVYTKMDCTPPLTAAHKTARMNWAEEPILKPDKWISAIFSNEKKFNLDGPDGFKCYWRGMRRPAQSYVRRQNGGGSIMVWTAFSAAGKSQVAILRGRQNSARECFDACIARSKAILGGQHYGVAGSLTGLQPNRKRMVCNGCEGVCPWAPVLEPEDAVLAAWDAIGQEYLLKLVESMPRCCLAVIKHKG